ncbi:hypothetical protein Ahy_B08g092062 [Arachis hypogaea]|uniref:Aminotransferase-like plant mobile domain-containing protein n=1 Tax=Arachis hypogaea TaxID=3818 RepID=A0A444Y360_ARAHY|nr:hypothetical protein Ahy_B08g092062 [Arachis hypogaea]
MVSLRHFVFHNSLITTFVECWHPETYMFHQLWGEATITLQDVMYHIGLHAHEEPVGVLYLHGFGTESTICPRQMIQQVEQSGPSLVAATTCGLSDVPWSVLGFGGACMDLLFTLQHIKRGTTDIASCILLLMSWIYQRFSQLIGLSSKGRTNTSRGSSDGVCR